MGTNLNKKSTKMVNNPMVIRKQKKEILLSIAQGNNTIVRLSMKLKRDKSLVHRQLKALINKGLVKKEKQNSRNVFYYLTSLSNQIILSETVQSTKTSLHPSTVNKRAEKISLKIKIIKKPDNWEYQRRRILQKNDIEFSVNNLKNTKIYSHTYENVYIRNTSQHIILNFPEEPIINADIFWTNILKKLSYYHKFAENFYKIKLSDEFTIISQEFADTESAIKNYAEKTENDKYYIFYDPIDRKPRWKIDKSQGLEFETMHSIFAGEDFDKINNELLYDFVSTKSLKPSEMTSKLEQHESQHEETEKVLEKLKEINQKTARNIYNLSEGAGELGDNMRSHVSLIKNIDHSISQLTKVVSRLNEKIEPLDNKINSWDDLNKYSNEIERLSESEKKRLGNRLFERFSI